MHLTRVPVATLKPMITKPITHQQERHKNTAPFTQAKMGYSLIMRHYLHIVLWLACACASGAAETQFPIGSSINRTALAAANDPKTDLYALTSDGVNAETVKRYATFEEYFNTAASSREGKILEAEFARRYNLAGSPTICVPTAAIGAPTDPVDLIIVDRRTGKVSEQIQCKRTLTIDNILDDRYTKCRFATTKESYAQLTRSINDSIMGAQRRGVEPTASIKAADKAISSGRVYAEVAPGSPLPSLAEVSKISRETTHLKWTAIAPELPTTAIVTTQAAKSSLPRHLASAPKGVLEATKEAAILVYVVELGKYAVALLSN